MKTNTIKKMEIYEIVITAIGILDIFALSVTFAFGKLLNKIIGSMPTVLQEVTKGSDGEWYITSNFKETADCFKNVFTILESAQHWELVGLGIIAGLFVIYLIVNTIVKHEEVNN